MKNALSLSLLVLIASIASSSVHAEEKKDGKNFESQKAEILTHIDGRIQKMQEHRGCVSAATDRDALKKCRETMREHMEDAREEHRERREERREKRKEAREKRRG